MPDLTWPLALLLLPLPWLLGRVLPRWGPEPAMRWPMQPLQPGSSRTVAAVAWLVWVCVVVALAGPRWPVEVRVVRPVPLQPVVWVIDLSASMDAEDLLLQGKPASRLAVARTVAADMRRQMPHNPAGLVVFGDHAYVRVALTRDGEAFDEAAAGLVTGLAGKGSALDEALTLALQRVQGRPAQIVLLTDGDLAASDETLRGHAESVRAQGGGIHVLILGRARGSPAGAKLPEGLAGLAAASGGRLARVGERAAFVEWLDSLKRLAQPATVAETTIYREAGVVPLAVALILSLLLAARLTRRGEGA